MLSEKVKHIPPNLKDVMHAGMQYLLAVMAEHFA